MRHIIAMLFLFSFFVFFGCSEADLASDDGDNGPHADEDQDLSVDGDLEEGVELEEDGVEDEGEQELPKGGISGAVYLDVGMDQVLITIALFDRNPLGDDEDIDPFSELEFGPNPGVFAYSFGFADLEAGTYYLAGAHTLEAEEDPWPHSVSPYADPIEIDPADPALRDFTGADIHIGTANPDLGSIAGAIHLGEDEDQYGVILMASRNQPFVEDNFWPSSMVYLPPGDRANPRAFRLNNLPDGDFHLVALLEVGGADDMRPYLWPLSPVTILTSDPERKDISGIEFYIGLDDPSLGSVSGELHLSAPVGNADVSLILFDREPEENVPPVVAYEIDYSPGQTTLPFHAGNLADMPIMYLGGLLGLEDGRETFGISGPFEINLSVPEQTHLEGIVIDIATVTLTGTFTLANGPTDFTLASMIFMEFVVDDYEYRGGSEFQLEAETGEGIRSGAFEIFPILNGNLDAFVLLDTDNNGIDHESDISCVLGSVIIDGATATVSQDFDADYTACNFPGESVK